MALCYPVGFGIILQEMLTKALEEGNSHVGDLVKKAKVKKAKEGAE